MLLLIVIPTLVRIAVCHYKVFVQADTNYLPPRYFMGGGMKLPVFQRYPTVGSKIQRFLII
jgi:hypothetical protein